MGREERAKRTARRGSDAGQCPAGCATGIGRDPQGRQLLGFVAPLNGAFRKNDPYNELDATRGAHPLSLSLSLSRARGERWLSRISRTLSTVLPVNSLSPESLAKRAIDPPRGTARKLARSARLLPPIPRRTTAYTRLTLASPVARFDHVAGKYRV